MVTTGRHRRAPEKRAAAGGRSALRARLRSRARRLEVIGLLIGLAVGLIVAVTALAVRGNLGGSGRPNVPAAPPPATIAPQVVNQSGTGPDPAALDAEWSAYSDRSTCADWAGGDGLSSIRLSSSQLAWFFSDTYLGPAGPTTGFSHLSGFVHNSVVIQTTAGRGSTFVTMTGGGACGRPGGLPGPVTYSVVGPQLAPGAVNDRYWDGDGLAIGGTVFKFYNRFLPGGPAPFIPTGTVIATFPVSQLSSAGHGSSYGEVARPGVTVLPSYTPPAGGSPIVWGAALLQTGNTVYVYGTQTPNPSASVRQLYLARVAAAQLTQFSAWQFYTGPGQWSAGQQNAQSVESAASGFTVSTGFSVVQIAGRYWLIQAAPQVGSPDIDAYPAATPWGPFDPATGVLLYRDSTIGLDPAHDYRIMYEARAELGLSTSHTLVIGYNVNSEAVTAGCVPMSTLTNTVTQPRFISIPLAAFGDSAGLSRYPATAGPSDYPPIVQRDPAQWFDSWSYPTGCPPVPGVASVQARPRAGAVDLTWPTPGLGVRYQVYVLAPGASGYSLATTARSGSATLTGLQAGIYLARVVPANLHHATGPAAQVMFTVP